MGAILGSGYGVKARTVKEPDKSVDEQDLIA
jgi:hypothetical protein